MSDIFPFLTDKQLTDHTDRLLDLSLPKSQWTHAGHLSAAYDLLHRYPEEHLIRIMPDLIRNYNEATSTPNTDQDGYHHTITLFYIRAIAHFIRCQSPDSPFLEGCRALVTGPYGAKDFMLMYYSKAALFSVTARREWMAPDKNIPEFALF
ncbi:hypothetical protein [Paremcibacter congregatus]|uniref:hypothetical protein n=1 Tax=Paremcibacter congregatus TaxID=2043170 RepID=UPI003A9304BD